jgi:predicted alpha/beta superfamily hydrolase
MIGSIDPTPPRRLHVLPLLLTVMFFLLHGRTDAQSKLPQSASGRVVRHADFPSKHLSARHVDVWLPEGYTKDRRYDVLYMHDGQMLFDSTITWNRQEWGVDETMGRLLSEGKIRDCIVVGVWNAGSYRHAEYFPQKPFESLDARVRDSILKAGRRNGQVLFQGESIRSDEYLRFLVHELKPFIDENYSTRKGRGGTFIAGSSMGGLISLYAICEYPRVFGGAACLSTHWPGLFTLEGNPVPDAFLGYLRKGLPSPRRHKIYFDCGDATLDALYPAIQREVDGVMRERGYAETNWLTRYFPGEDHSEKSWSKRLEIPLTFLLRR